jgi:hypothetical protein
MSRELWQILDGWYLTVAILGVSQTKMMQQAVR